MSNLKNNTASLEALLEQANALPEEKKIQASKTITPTKSAQTAQPDNGYDGLAQVTVEAIPAAYQDVTGVTATAANVLTGSKFVNSSGTLTSGTMPNNGTLSSTIDGLETTSVSIPKGYTDGGTIALDSTIDNTADSQAAQIAEIKAMLSGKSVGGGSSGDSIETCTVEINNNSSSYSSVYYTTVDANGKLVSVYNGSNNAYQRTINNVVCGSCVVVYTSASKFTTTNCEVLFQTTTAFYVVHITASAGEIAKVTSTMSGGGSGN